MSTRPTLPAPIEARPRRCRHGRIDPGSPRPSELLRGFFLTALGFITAAMLAGILYAVTDAHSLHWLALHLLLLGGVSQLVLRSAQNVWRRM